MSVFISIFWIFIKRFIVVDCAPKIGHVLFDPLAYETSNFNVDQESSESSDSYLSDEAVLSLRTEKDFEAEPKKPCNGYEFDENKCIQVNERILCGYNKNMGEMKSKDKIVDLGNGCHQRGDRIECGYANGPFKISSERPIVEQGDTGDLKHNIRMRHVPMGSTVQGTESTLSKRPKAVIPEHKQVLNRVNLKDLEIKVAPNDQTKTTLDNLETPETSTYKVKSTNTLIKTTQTTNSEMISAKTLSARTESNTAKDLSTLTPEINSTRTNSTIPSITDETVVANVTTNLGSNAEHITERTDESTKEYNLAKVNTLPEILGLSERHTRKADIINTFASNTTVLESNITTSNNSSKTVCVEKGDRVFCYNFNV